MPNKQIWQISLSLIRHHPYVWLIVLLAGVGDLYAVLAYNPFSTRLTMEVLLLAFVTLLAEAGLIYALSQHLMGRPSSFIDDVMAAVTSFVYVLIVKALPLILLAIIAVFSLLFYSVLVGFLDWLGIPAITFAVAVFLVVCGIVLFVWTQIWTIFALRVVLTGNATDFISEAWEAFWNHKRQLAKLVLPLVLVDLLLLGGLWSFGGITRESILEYTVTEEIAAQSSGVGEVESAGTQTSFNRILNALLTTSLKGRGADLASLSLLVIDNVAVGIVVALIGMLFMPVRIGVLTAAALVITNPDLEVPATI